MATMITEDCINCGACEPECPNNAISQGPTVFVIDPKLCTECVGFHDYEACAAVCPVDVCVTDPNNIESEEVLIARARALHPDTDFGDNFESRFRKGQGKPAAPAPKAAPAVSNEPAPAAVRSAAGDQGARSAIADADVKYLALPAIDSWTVPMRCFKCNEVHVENVKNFTIGNVIFCPHCHKSTVVRDNLNYQIRTLLTDAYDKWQKEQEAFAAQRERELAEFVEQRAKEAQSFESHQQRELERLRQALETIGDNYDAPGKPFKKGSRFGWA